MQRGRVKRALSGEFKRKRMTIPRKEKGPAYGFQLRQPLGATIARAGGARKSVANAVNDNQGMPISARRCSSGSAQLYFVCALPELPVASAHSGLLLRDAQCPQAVWLHLASANLIASFISSGVLLRANKAPADHAAPARRDRPRMVLAVSGSTKGGCSDALLCLVGVVSPRCCHFLIVFQVVLNQENWSAAVQGDV